MIPMNFEDIKLSLEWKSYKQHPDPMHRLMFIKKVNKEETSPIYIVEIYFPFLYLKYFTEEGKTIEFKFPIPIKRAAEGGRSDLTCIIDTAESFFANESSFTY